jgi:hypothetical protein
MNNRYKSEPQISDVSVSKYRIQLAEPRAGPVTVANWLLPIGYREDSVPQLAPDGTTSQQLFPTSLLKITHCHRSTHYVGNVIMRARSNSSSQQAVSVMYPGVEGHSLTE